MESDSYKVLEWAEHHPYILLSAVICLVILILIMYFDLCSFTSGKRGRKSRKNYSPDEIDHLIEEIHEKQKRK